MHPYGTVSIQMWLLRSQGQREMPRKGRLPRVGEYTLWCPPILGFLLRSRHFGVQDWEPASARGQQRPARLCFAPWVLDSFRTG